MPDRPSRSLRSDVQEDFGGAALVHGLVALGGLVEREGGVEDLAGVDLAGPDEVDEVGRKRRTGPGRLGCGCRRRRARGRGSGRCGQARRCAQPRAGYESSSARRRLCRLSERSRRSGKGSCLARFAATTVQAVTTMTPIQPTNASHCGPAIEPTSAATHAARFRIAVDPVNSCVIAARRRYSGCSKAAGVRPGRHLNRRAAPARWPASPWTDTALATSTSTGSGHERMSEIGCERGHARQPGEPVETRVPGGRTMDDAAY
jgi:hypothetical protein